MASVFLFVFFLLSHLPLLHSAEEGMIYTQKCPPSSCGNLEMTGFPFINKAKPGCDVFRVDCRDPYLTIQLEFGGRLYEVKSISQNTSIHIVETEPWKHPDFNTCESLTNLTFPIPSFISFEITAPNQTFFKCKGSILDIPAPNNLTKKSCKDDYNIYYSNSSDRVPSNLSNCSIIPLLKKPDPLLDGDDLFALLTPEFDLIVRVSEECKPNNKGKLICGGADKGTGSNNNVMD